MGSKTPPRRPRSPPRRLQDRPRHLQEASRRLQDVQDRLQDDSKIAQEASKRLPDASKTAKIASKTPPRLSNRLPNAFLAPKSPLSLLRRPPKASRCLLDVQYRFQDRPKMFGSFFKSLLPCQVHAKFLPGSEVRQRLLSAMTKHDGRLPSPWPLTKGGLAGTLQTRIFEKN